MPVRPWRAEIRFHKTGKMGPGNLGAGIVGSRQNLRYVSGLVSLVNAGTGLINPKEHGVPKDTHSMGGAIYPPPYYLRNCWSE